MHVEVPEKNKQLYQIGLEFYRTKNLTEAAHTFLFIVAIDPQDRQARAFAAKILREIDHIPERAQARALLERGLEDPDIGLTSESVFDLLQMYKAIGPIEKARQLLTSHKDQILEHIGQDYFDAVTLELDAELETELESNDKQKRISRAQYPSTEVFNGRLHDLFDKHILTDFDPAPVQFNSSESVMTMGSCFAERISSLMVEKGLDAYNLGLAETVNTTFANKDLINYATGASKLNPDYWQWELEARDETPETIVEKIKRAKVIVYTLGVGPAFFDKKTGEFVPHSVSSFKTREFALNNTNRMTTVEENVENLTAIFDQLSALNPDFGLVLTVSPVPLRATFERGSAIVSDCVSKSTLRVAAEQFCAAHKDRVVYWPSFELVKWVSPHREPFYGTDDGFSIHISDDVVSVIVEAFLKKCLRDDA